MQDNFDQLVSMLFDTDMRTFHQTHDTPRAADRHCGITVPPCHDHVIAPEL
jgi:hypothetical protein